MSELTPCNYCSLKRIREQAKREGMKVTKAPAEWAGSGTDILAHPTEVSAADAKADRDKYFKAWLQVIPDSCCC